MTGLAPQTLSLRFDRGIDSKSDKRLVEPPYLLNLENGVFTEGGGIKKRPGTVSLTRSTIAGDNISAGAALATFDDELLVFDDAQMYSYSKSAALWLTKGTAVSFKSTRRRIIANDAEQTDQDMALAGNVALFAWKDTRGGVYASVVDLQTGVYYLADTQISTTGTNPRCVAIGSRLFVLYVVSGALRVRWISGAVPTGFQVENTLVTDVDAACVFDVAPYDSDSAVFAYGTNVNTVKVGYLTVNGFLGAPGNGYASVITVSEHAQNSVAIVVDSTPSKIYVAYHNGTAGLRAFSRNDDLTQNFAPVTVDSTTTTMRNITGAFASSTSIQWFYEQDAASDHNQLVRQNTLTTSGTAGAAAVFKRSVGLASKAWRYNGKVYVTCAHDSTLQATYFVFDSSGTLLGKQLGTVAGGLSVSSGLPRVEALATGVYVWAALEKGKLRADADATVFSMLGVTMLRLDYTSNSRFSAAQLGQNLHVVGGVLQAYDGNALVEHGFHLFPENVSAATSNGAGTLLNGTYGYKVVYEWTDAQGQVHRSAPSATLSVTLSGSDDTVTLTIPTLRVTGKSRVVIAVYRSTSGTSSTFYRVSSIAAPTLNDTTADTVSFVDTLPDASITSAEILYTVGGVLDNDAAPACSTIVAGKRRLFLVGDDGAIWYSKKTVQGEGAAFSLAQRIEQEGVSPTALAVLDDKVIVFEPHRIFAFAGDGPNALGQQDSFTSLELINTDVGCDAPVSIVRTSDGIMFKSAKGIYLLDRALQASYIGWPVEAYNGETITSAVLVEGTNEVRFTTESSRCLVYDYLFKQWSTFTGYASEDAAMWNGTYVSLRSNGKVRQESSSLYTDDGNGYERVIETAWIKLAGLQGFKRVRRAALLGEYKSSHVLEISAGYDYRDEYANVYTWDTDTGLPTSVWGDEDTWGDSEVWGGTNDRVYQARVHLAQQKCQAIRFKIRDTGSSGESSILSGLDLEVAIIGKLARLGAAKSL